MATLKELETSEDGTTEELTAVLEQLQFNERGLIPAIAQDSDSGEVLMMAWMDQHAIQRSLDEGFAVYFSPQPSTVLAQGRYLWTCTRTCKHVI